METIHCVAPLHTMNTCTLHNNCHFHLQYLILVAADTTKRTLAELLITNVDQIQSYLYIYNCIIMYIKYTCRWLLNITCYRILVYLPTLLLTVYIQYMELFSDALNLVFNIKVSKCHCCFYLLTISLSLLQILTKCVRSEW